MPLRTAKTPHLDAADVAGMFRHAMKDGLVLANPAVAMARLPELDSAEREVFTVAEVGKMVNAAGNLDWQTGMIAAKVDRRTTRQGVKGARAQHARSFHALRHSLTSVLANPGWN